jgi:hypothetical protein
LDASLIMLTLGLIYTMIENVIVAVTIAAIVKVIVYPQRVNIEMSLSIALLTYDSTMTLSRET